MHNKTKYKGRFAPTPSGDLHFGSLVSAMASYADARKNNGKWIIRIDDIDTARIVKGATQSILNSLEDLGFEWDDEIVYQSDNIPKYSQLLDRLKSQNLIYPCFCSRRKLKADNNLQIYSGLCRKLTTEGAIKQNFSLRIETNNNQILFKDAIQGIKKYRLNEISGDFIIKRADNIFSYQLSNVADNYIDGITHIVRASDLLESTPKQIFLQKLFNYPTPLYSHIPIVKDVNGIKLSKSCQANKVASNITSLFDSAIILGQKVDSNMKYATIEEFWIELIKHWDSNRIPKKESICLDQII